jgi:hypothetical protein
MVIDVGLRYRTGSPGWWHPAVTCTMEHLKELSPVAQQRFQCTACSIR